MTALGEWATQVKFGRSSPIFEMGSGAARHTQCSNGDDGKSIDSYCRKLLNMVHDFTNHAPHPTGGGGDIVLGVGGGSDPQTYPPRR